MVTEELETGLYLDRPLQEYIERFTVTKITDFLMIDELHADENLKFFSLLSYKTSPLKHKTIYNPPLQNGGSGTDSTNTGTGGVTPVPIDGTKMYRLSFYQFEGYSFVRVKNVTDNNESYVFKRKDLEYWNKVVNKIKKDFYA